MSTDRDYEIAVEELMKDYAPKLEAALTKMNGITLNSIQELKQLKSPHPSIVLCIHALATLLGESINEKDKEKIWPKLKSMLSTGKTFLDNIFNLDIHNIPNATKKKMKQFLKNPSFTPEVQRANSVASAEICNYVYGVMDYSQLLDEIAEKKVELASLHEACRTANKPRILTHLTSPSCDINHKNSQSMTPLMVAVDNNHLDVVELLIEHKADVNMGSETANPVILAIKKQNADILRVLLKSGVVVVHNLAAEGLSPMRLALDTNNQSIVDLLAEYDASCMIEFLESLKTADAIGEFILSYSKFHLPLLSQKGHILWFYLIQIENDSIDISPAIKSIVEKFPQLGSVEDNRHRSAVDVAAPSNKLAIKSVFLWHGRYRITQNQPEHQSATCFVYKAIDEGSESNEPLPVALKFMRFKAHYRREIGTRKINFSSDYVVDILRSYPPESEIDSWPEDSYEKISERAALEDSNFSLTKLVAESMFLIVMPLADRNMFVSLKQERYAGKNMEEVRHIFTQLLNCVSHVHSKGILHADIKTLNIVRLGHTWKLIDMDAAGLIGQDTVGFKSSSAYLPPEALYVINPDQIIIKTPDNFSLYSNHNHQFELLIAHPSFDVWSLGCILYQLCTEDVRPLFQGGQDDNLTSFKSDIGNNLWALFEWSDDLKQRKLSMVFDKQARNLLSQMLQKDASKRPSLDRIANHPFLTKKKTIRMIGEKAEFDFFISYRVASDLYHAEKLYNMLTEKGVKVWWDRKCLKPGEDWKVGFCAGLVNSRNFICILSKNAINHPEKPYNNYSKLVESSPCDNLYLEHRFGLELHDMGLLDKIFPVMIGEAEYNYDSYNFEEASGVASLAGTDITAAYPPSSYRKFYGSLAPIRELSDTCVTSVENELIEHMENQGLGTPISPNRSVASVVAELMKYQGAFVEGDAEISFQLAVESIAAMNDDDIQSLSVSSSRPSISTIGVHRDIIESKDLELNLLRLEVQKLTAEINRLMHLRHDKE